MVDHFPKQNARCLRPKLRFDESLIEEMTRPRATPIFYQNDFGAVTMRWQFLIYYEYQLAAGLPIGPHVFGLR